MHFNLHNEYRLSPDLDQFGAFSYAETSEVSTYQHPPIHYKRLENPDAVKVLHPRCIPAGNITITHYADIVDFMREASNVADLFPKWMQQSSISFVNVDVHQSVKKVLEDGSVTYVKEHTTIPSMEFDQKYMSLYESESSYHSLSSTEQYEDYENEMKQVMEEIESIGGQDPENQNWSTIEAFQHLDSHRYEMKAQKDMPLMDLERPMNSM